MKKVLVVDDDADILEAIRLILATAGHESELITKGDETYQKVKDYNPDIIILDVLLSGNDGRTICKTLKEDKQTRKIPIVMISAHPSAKHSVKECGADSFVAKPFSMGELLTQVQKLT